MPNTAINPAAFPAQRSSRVLLLLVAAATIISLSMGVRQSLGLFLQPINIDFGVSASAFGLAMALQNIVWGVSQPFIGMFGDRYGAQPVLVGSAVVYAGGLLLMAFGGPVLGLNAGGGVMIGLGVAGTGYGVLVGAVSRAVAPERRTQTVGLVAAAGSLATFVLAPLGQALIAGYGWRIALVVFAGVALAMGAIAIAIGRELAAAGTSSDAPRAGEALSINQALLDAAGHRGFVAMAVAFFACGFQLMFITTHLPQFLAICGVAPSVSASAIGIIGLSNAVGSYLFGILGARYSQKKLLALIYLLRTLSIVVFLAAPIDTTSTLVFAAAMGFTWLGVVPLVSGLIRGLFGLRYFNTLFGLVFLSHQVGAFVGAWLGGVTFDMTGSYATAWTAMIVVGIAATVIQWLMDDRALPGRRAGGQAALQAATA